MLDRNTVEQNLLKNIIVSDNGCWEWQGSRNLKGYGVCRYLNQRLVHRVSFILYRGPVFGKMCVLHKCDNPPCVNPNHLFIGTVYENNKDCKMKGRLANQNTHKKICKRGHPLIPATIRKKGKNGRQCLICERAAKKLKRSK